MFVNFQHVLNLLFDSASVQKDMTFETAKVPLQLGALGSSNVFQGKYEGFGNSPNDKEGNIHSFIHNKII